MGGNKARKLEFLLGDAIRNDATTVITVGAVQSNHVRQTAAAANRCGLSCIALLEERSPELGIDYLQSGNVLLDHLLGAEIRRYQAGTDMSSMMHSVAEEVQRRGETPYLIPGGGSNVIGTMGYVLCAQELTQQADAMGIKIDYIVHGSGSAGTQAGLIAGLALESSDTNVLGISVKSAKELQEEKVYSLALESADRLEILNAPGRHRITVSDDYIGLGYGIMTPQVSQAIQLVAKYEGLLLDPVYSGKAMSGLIDLAKRGMFSESDNVVFLHTGGSPGLFAYMNYLPPFSTRETYDFVQ
jgi:L-cysteate sulfo-lyase